MITGSENAHDLPGEYLSYNDTNMIIIDTEFRREPEFSYPLKTWSVCQLAYLLATENFHDKRRDGDGPTKKLGRSQKSKTNCNQLETRIDVISLQSNKCSIWHAIFVFDFLTSSKKLLPYVILVQRLAKVMRELPKERRCSATLCTLHRHRMVKDACVRYANSLRTHFCNICERSTEWGNSEPEVTKILKTAVTARTFSVCKENCSPSILQGEVAGGAPHHSHSPVDSIEISHLVGRRHRQVGHSLGHPFLKNSDGKRGL